MKYKSNSLHSYQLLESNFSLQVLSVCLPPIIFTDRHHLTRTTPRR